MSAFIYGAALQWKLDIRSKTLLITCYLVPLLFFAVMGGIFTSINPLAKDTLIQSMTVMGISMGAIIGLPPSLVEIYGSDIKNVYKANGVPVYLGAITLFISAFVHLLIMSAIIFAIALIAFEAKIPANLLLYLGMLATFTGVSLGIGSVLGLLVKDQAKITMVSQIIFLPSIMLSGIMFPTELLPQAFGYIGMILPATWGFKAMSSESFEFGSLIPLIVIFLVCFGICVYALSRKVKE
jgi:ABC-2 type transport system permease protein